MVISTFLGVGNTTVFFINENELQREEKYIECYKIFKSFLIKWYEKQESSLIQALVI